VSDIPPEVDLLVLGAGAGGMTAALTASVLGLQVLLIEKTVLVGGTSARSAGSVWVPNAGIARRAGTASRKRSHICSKPSAIGWIPTARPRSCTLRRK
jgi:glycine/D-amino acid oxidase-like deaminating enzyme